MTNVSGAPCKWQQRWELREASQVGFETPPGTNASHTLLVPKNAVVALKRRSLISHYTKGIYLYHI